MKQLLRSSIFDMSFRGIFLTHTVKKRRRKAMFQLISDYFSVPRGKVYIFCIDSININWRITKVEVSWLKQKSIYEYID